MKADTKNSVLTGTIKIDEVAEQAYCQFLYGREVAKTVENGEFIEDYDSEGNLIGFEFPLKTNYLGV